MLRWLGPRKAPEPPDSGAGAIAAQNRGDVTDDPLAAIDTGHRGQQQIYSVSRSVYLPRVSLKNTASVASGGGVNPLFIDGNDNSIQNNKKLEIARQGSPGEKFSSSGYEGSNDSLDPLYHHQDKIRDDPNGVVEQNPTFVKSITVQTRNARSSKPVPSHSSSSGAGTLTTIPEGKVDLPVPKPIWPLDDKKLLDQYDSLVDDALLLYTSLNYNPSHRKSLETCIDFSVKELLVELLTSIDATLEGKNGTPAEDMLKIINEKIRVKLDALKNSTEEEMKKLCVNLSNCKKMNSVLRAFSNSSSSGNSSQSFPEWTSNRIRTLSSETEDIYQAPSGSSSSGFSDSVKDRTNVLPVFVHEELGSVPNGIRNAMIYGTLCRAKASNDMLLGKTKKTSTLPKKSLLRAMYDNKPSVWEQYYGVKAVEVSEAKYVTKPTDVPLFVSRNRFLS
ncbi:hypothetical protein NQ315_009301 [Exocentrus adspersus]|uniref:Uncharacterized protein n=1 Tax=Exocentrus adspersus TaxID=1586481 RepID=A0AAV8WGK0_9CUCU|nr:hypothetical protein NQ315_009301 [Exocentrus adspersus]